MRIVAKENKRDERFVAVKDGASIPQDLAITICKDLNLASAGCNYYVVSDNYTLEGS